MVFHLAARPGVRDSWHDFDDYVRSNIRGTKALFDACAGRDVRVVYASSSSVYGDATVLPVTEAEPTAPISPYGATKVMTEVMAGAYRRADGLDVVGLRYFTVYGPRQRPDMGLARFIEAAVEGRHLSIYGDGRQLRDYTYVGDVVDAPSRPPSAAGKARSTTLRRAILARCSRSSTSLARLWVTSCCSNRGRQARRCTGHLGLDEPRADRTRLRPGDAPGRWDRRSGRRGRPAARDPRGGVTVARFIARSGATTPAIRSALTH